MRTWPQFYDRLRQFSIAAIDRLRGRLSAGETIPIRIETVPVKQTGSSWTYQDKGIPLHGLFLSKHMEELKSMAEYRQCEEFMMSESRIAAHLNQLVGTGSGASGVTAENLLLGIIKEQLKQGNHVEFRDDVFDAIYMKVEEFLTATSLSFEAWIPLDNFSGPPDTINLLENIEITLIPEDKLSEWYGLLEDSEWRRSAMEWSHGIRVLYELPKRIGRAMIPPEKALEAENVVLFQPSVDVLSALRLLKGGLVREGPVFIKQRTWQPDTGLYAGIKLSGVGVRGPTYSINKDDGNRLKEIFSLIRKVKKDRFRFLTLALRRFNQSYDRYEAEDRLIDHMIAFEALYLNDTGSGEYRGELRFRLALRTAFFLREGDQRKTLSKEMADAYDIRSSIVHGDEYDLPKINGKTLSINEFVIKIEGYLRESLCKFITLAQGESVPRRVVEWDDVIFGKNE